MDEHHLLTREQLDEIILFAIKEGGFNETLKVELDTDLMRQMIDTLLQGFDSYLGEGDSEIFEWIAVGVANDWCSVPSCATHDGIPMDEDEEEEWEDGMDPCQHVLRLWSE